EGRHREIGPCSDVYSIGAILYHLLTGRPPFVGETLAVTLRQVAQDEPLAPRLLNPAVPRDVQTICLKCLEKEPARRYVTAQELADELGRVQRDEPIRARPIGAVEHVWRWCRRRPALASSLSAAVLFLVAGLTATSWQWRRAERHARDLRATVTRLKLDQAEERLAGGETAKGLALLAALLRENPANRVAAQRVVSVLMQRNFLRPLPGSAETWHSRWTSGFAQREHLLITTTNEGCTLTLWDTKDGLNLRRSIEVGEAVRHSDLSRDGRLLLVATQAKSLRLYDLTDGSLRAGPYPIGGFTEQLLLSPDAALGIVVAGPDEALANWRTIKGKVIRLADGQQLYEKAQFHWAAFSPNGRWVVTAHYGAAQIRDADSWEPVDEPLIEASRINTAEFSPDSSCVVTASADFNATVWNAASGDQLFRLVHPVNVQAASFSPDGTRIFTRDNANNGRIWDAAGGKLLGQAFPQQKGHGPASFSPDGRRFLSYSRNTIVLREVETSSPLAEPLVASDLPTRARFLPDGRRFVVTTMDGSTRLWDAAPTVFAPRIFPEKLEMSNGSLSPDGTKVAIAVKSNWGRIWDAETGEPVAPYLRHNPGQVTSLRWSLDSSFVVTASLDRTARIWDARTGSQRGDALQHGSSVTEVEFSPDGRWLATASEDGTVRIWSTANHEAVSPPLKHGNIVRRARFSPDGSLLGTASLDRTVRIWSVPEGREIGASMTNELEFSDVVFSPEGRRLATAGKASYAQIWDVQSRRQLTPPLRHTGYVSTVRFSPDGSRVVTTSSDGTARVWDAVTGQPVARPLRHREEVTLAEFSPGGRFVLTASMDGTARLWDVDTGHAVSDPFRHDERIVAGQWARDGKNFLTVSYDRRAKLWPIFLAPEGAVVPWLADLAEATAVLRLEGEEIFGHIPMEQVIATHKRLRTPERSDLWGEWLKSFFAPRVSRSVPQPPAEP
ncbi:MAG TPA: hypothetical protein VJW76_00540, partial [Verrucomicrobiae bacterium]|nr:hypothetical protein [Verrucomicrobiae bacterium]